MMASHFFRRLPLKSTITQFTYSKPYSPIVSIKFRISSFHTASTILSEEDVNFRNIDLTKVTIDSSRANVAPSSLDREKELFALKRALSAQYSKGNYEMALRIAVDLLDKTEKLYGKKNPVYASCLNNIALMQKMMGEYDMAMNRYIEALHVYEDVQGKNSASYASTLSNLGSLYRLKAAESSGMAKNQNLMRADEALTDSLKLRQKILGNSHRDTITSEILLAGLRRSQGKSQDALDILHNLLDMVKDQFSAEDLIVATVENNLGLAYKELKQYDEARGHYVNASLIRTKILGESHPESIVVLHNLAECYHAMGREKEALALQEKILSFVEVEGQSSNSPSPSDGTTAVEKSPAGDGSPASQQAAPPNHPHANLNINANPGGFSSSPPKKPAPETQYKPVSRKRR